MKQGCIAVGFEGLGFGCVATASRHPIRDRAMRVIRQSPAASAGSRLSAEGLAGMKIMAGADR
jgi:hypothetical protein